MCGIAGFVGNGSKDELERMVASLAHRGPDDTGFLVHGAAGLGHARLSIIDTSARAHQPMSLPDGSVTVILNGEIYNFSTLREELRARGCVFQSSSDTEVILWLYKLEGAHCFKKLAGMFAIALYDFKENMLILARDRMGEKPLYWRCEAGTLFFASELRAFFAIQSHTRELDLSAVNQYLLFDYVPTPATILKGVYKLEPATTLTFKEGRIRKERFWNPPRSVHARTEEEALAALHSHLSETVSRELVSDVPLGVFLSGGIDSSTIAYYAQKNAARPIDTFSIGFDDPSFDESRFAHEVAAHLGTNHHEEQLRAEDTLALVPSIADVLSEPVADASVIPSMLLSRFARGSVTVALGGDGGDELFAGYPTFQAENAFRYYQGIPVPVRRLFSRVVDSLPASHGNFSFSYNLKKFISSDETHTVRRHLEWLGSFSKAGRAALAAGALREHVRTDDIFKNADAYAEEMPDNDPGNQLAYTYARTYLMDDVLVKVDRASMRYALETRAPFLDHAIVDFVFSLPYRYKYRHGTTKYLLKKLMQGKLPPHIIARKKKGFGIPLARWLTGPLKPLCDELLSEHSLAAHGLFNFSYVEHLKEEHRNRVRDNRKELWNLMVFQLWYDRWMR